jgi:hypothetical protein
MKKRKTKAAPASPLVASAEGTSPERGRARENAAPNGPRTRLGDGVVKPVGSRIEWASRLRRLPGGDGWACPCGGRRAIVADLSEGEGIVALRAHLPLPPEAPPRARARSPAFDFAGGVTGSGRGRARRVVARAEVGPEGDARDLRALVGVILPSVARAGGARPWGWRCEIGLPWPTLRNLSRYLSFKHSVIVGQP